LDCIADRKEPEIEEFLLECFNQCEKVSKLKAPKNSIFSGADLLDRLASLLHDLSSTRALEAVLARRDILPPASFNQVFRSALRIWPKDKVFQEFSPFLGQKKGAAKEKGEMIQQVIWAACHHGV